MRKWPFLSSDTTQATITDVSLDFLQFVQENAAVGGGEISIGFWPFLSKFFFNSSFTIHLTVPPGSYKKMASNSGWLKNMDSIS